MTTETDLPEAKLREIIERLRALAKKWGQGEGAQDGRLAIADEAADALASIRAERDAAVEALKPFAEAADLIPPGEEDFKVVAHVPAGPHAAAFRKMGERLTAGAFRAARAIAGEPKNGA